MRVPGRRRQPSGPVLDGQHDQANLQNGADGGKPEDGARVAHGLEKDCVVGQDRLNHAVGTEDLHRRNGREPFRSEQHEDEIVGGLFRRTTKMGIATAVHSRMAVRYPLASRSSSRCARENEAKATAWTTRPAHRA